MERRTGQAALAPGGAGRVARAPRAGGVCGRALAIAVSLLACGSPPEDPAGDAAPASGDIALVRIARWPGAGVELTLRVTPAGWPADSGAPADLSNAIRLEPDGGGELAFAARPTALAPGYTALLVQPAATAAAREMQRAALEALIASRPGAERIALFRWGAAVDQVASFTGDRALLSAALPAALAPLGAGEAPLPAEEALPAAARDAAEVGGAGGRVMRAVIVSGGAIPEAVREATVLPLVALEPGGDPAARAAAAGMAIDRLAAGAHYAIGVCPGPDAPPARLAVDDAPGAITVAWPAPWPESASAPCDPAAMTGGDQPVPERIELVFTDEQREVYDQRVGSLSKEEFALSVRLAPDQAPVPASAHLRGQTTLGCQRKSYTVTLDGSGRHLFRDTYDDEMYLLAMCADERYIQLHTAMQIMAGLALFPPRHRYVELAIDGETRGVYLLVEKADDALARAHSRTSAVLRRRFDRGDDYVEVEKATGDPAAAAAAWDELMERAAELSGEELEAELAARFDLRGLLTFMALMTAFENGDYVDEVWLTGSDARGVDGAVQPRWHLAGWDTDDLFAACHFGGQYAFDDPNGLSYCAEGALERMVLSDPFMYDRYVGVLEQLLTELTPERLQEVLDATGAALLPYFERPEICAASTELLEDHPGASEPDQAQAYIRDGLAELREAYAARRALLMDRIDSFRAESGR